MGSTAAEDKRTVAMNEAKIRDLQAKINALLNIEKDVRSCVEGLRSIEKETKALEEHKKELSDFKEQLSKKTADYNDFVSKRDVSHIRTNPPAHAHTNTLHSEQTCKCPKPKRKWPVHRNTPLTSELRANKHSKGSNRIMSKWFTNRQDNDKHVEQMRLQAD